MLTTKLTKINPVYLQEVLGTIVFSFVKPGLDGAQVHGTLYDLVVVLCIPGLNRVIKPDNTILQGLGHFATDFQAFVGKVCMSPGRGWWRD